MSTDEKLQAVSDRLEDRDKELWKAFTDLENRFNILEEIEESMSRILENHNDRIMFISRLSKAHLRYAEAFGKLYGLAIVSDKDAANDAYETLTSCGIVLREKGPADRHDG